MSATNKLGKGIKFLSVILGALLLGFMWRARGSHGFGAFWGMVAVGGIFTLFIFSFYGNRAKMKYELIPIGAVMMGITVPAWGCVINMPGGRAAGIEPFTGEEAERVIYFNQGRGILMMLLLGFSLICLYSIFAGSLFTEKEYKLYHYLIIIGVFFAVELAMKATLSHTVMSVLAPEISSAFKDGLADKGAGDSVRQAYLSHFNNISWAKHIPFGRYYFECVEHISFAAGAAAALIAVLIAFRDRVTFVIALCIDFAAALSITLADYFQINGYESSFLSKMNIPAALRIHSWGMWEFATGLIMGLLIMLILALVPDKYSAGRKYRSEPYIENRVLRFILIFLLWGFAFAVVPVRALSLRVCRMLEDYGYIKSEELPGIIATAVISVIICAFLFAKLKGNILDKNLPVPFRMKPIAFAGRFTLLLSLYYGAVYFFTLEASVPAFIYRSLRSSSPASLEGIEYFYVFLAAFVLFEIIYIPVRKRISSAR